MKKTKFAIIVFFLLSTSIFAFEGGGIIKTGLNFDIVKPKAEDSQLIFTLGHYDGIALWAKQNMDKEGNYNFNIQASYLFNLSKQFKPTKEKAELDHILNIDLLKFSFLIPLPDSTIKIDLGRYGLTDITRIIFDQSIDGFFLSYQKSNLICFFNIGYTGLLNAHVNHIRAINTRKDTKIYRLSPHFIQASALFHINLWKFKYALDLEADAYFGLGDYKKLSKGYFTLSTNGPIVSNLFFILSTGAEIRSSVSETKKAEFGFFLSGELDYYFTQYSTKIGLKTQWFSGDKYKFTTFTKTNASKTKFYEYSDLWKTGLFFSIKPVEELFLEAGLDVFCKGSKATEGASFYNGTELSAGLNYIILHDISIGLNTGIFIDNDHNIYSTIGLKGLISF